MSPVSQITTVHLQTEKGKMMNVQCSNTSMDQMFIYNCLRKNHVSNIHPSNKKSLYVYENMFKKNTNKYHMIKDTMKAIVVYCSTS